MISQSRTPAGILRTLTAILCLAAILMSVTGSSAWAAPRVVRVVGIQDGISDSQADYFRRTIAELNDLTEDRIFVSAHGDIEMAVKAMRRGAVDFLTKPVVDEKLLSSIDRAVARSCEEAAEAETVRELAGLWQALSPRECQVAQLAAEGLTTKAVSDVLGIAERTAQVHVAHVCSKLGVENAVGVAQIIARLRARGVLQ